MRKIRFVCLLLAIIFVPNANCLDEEIINRINEVAEAILACRDIVGMNLAVVQGGETVFTKGYGVIDMETNDPVTPQTLFGIASVTKHFSTTALALVLEEKGFTWDTRIRDILGDNFYFPDSLRTSQATLRDLAAHRLGMPRTDFIAWSDNYTRESEAYAQRFLDPVYGFRDAVLYNNNLYNMIGYITEVLTGKSWEDVVTERLFTPAKMASTTFVHKADVAAPNFAKPYTIINFGEPLRRVNDFVNSNSVRGGAGGSMASTADDMAEWMKVLLSKGTLDGVEIVPEHIMEEIRQSVNEWGMTNFIDSFIEPTIPASYVLPDYALGLKNGWYRDYQMISHSGDIVGYHSLLTLLPDMDIGLFSAVNGADLTSQGRRLFHSYVMDLLLGLEPWLNTSTVCTFPTPWVTENIEEMMASYLAEGSDMLAIVPTPPVSKMDYPTELSSYNGEYGNFYYGNISISVNDDRLTLSYGMADPYPLTLISENVFFGEASDRMWPSHIAEVSFAKSDATLQNYDQLTATFARSAPALFVRGRKMSEAPAPPNADSCI